ncbi:MAG: hypothetical protein KAT68_14665 [Bacteroidales bacterium]|nr:hypothetical protein [Bacteroidales bacterium]
MKTIYKHIVFLIFLFISITKLSAQDRNVVWVHGFGDDKSSWEHYEAIFTQERQINSLRETYNTYKGIDYAAYKVINSVNVLGSDATNPRNIAVGHSMGGLMIRDVDRLTGTSKRFGGLITVATPNYGAPIANSLIAGSVVNAAANACNKLGAGPIAQLFSLPWNIIGNNISTNYICKLFIENNFIQDLQNTSTTKNDLRVGSSTINKINSHNTTIPRISIWAQENSPVHWRMLSSERSEGANDTELISTVNNVRGVYNFYYTYNITRSINTSWWNPLLSAMYLYRANRWKKGRDWIDNSESVWNSLIKTTRVETHTYSHWEYRCVYYWGDRVIDPNDCEWKWVLVTTTQYVTVNYPSDGLLPEYTQKLKGIPGGNIYRVLGANHLEVRDMSNCPRDNTKIKFNEIWTRPYWDFFHTEKR